MTLGSKIASYRKKLNITQEALAQKLEVTNQAVSKWESDQCCPDILLLPRLADIFGITLDELFDRPINSTPSPKVNWANDNTLHVALFRGRTLVGQCEACQEMTFQYEGPALNIECALNLQCSDVAGNVHAGGEVDCGIVSGNVDAGGSVTCDDVAGDVHANGSVTCDCVEGNVQANGNVTCDSVEGSIQAGGNVTCDIVEGNVDAGGNVTCDEICGNATAKECIYCDEVNGSATSDERSGKNDIHIHRDDQSVTIKKKGHFNLTFRKD